MSGLIDNEIIKALECCSRDEACCSECPYIADFLLGNGVIVKMESEQSV